MSAKPVTSFASRPIACLSAEVSFDVSNVFFGLAQVVRNFRYSVLMTIPAASPDSESANQESHKCRECSQTPLSTHI